MSEERNIEEQPTDNTLKSPDNHDSITESSDITDQSSEENMEVHHPHHVTHKKK